MRMREPAHDTRLFDIEMFTPILEHHSNVRASKGQATLDPETATGRACGFERAMDNLGAIRSLLLSVRMVAVVSVRPVILVSVVLGLLASTGDPSCSPRAGA
ncbi:MAG: hypothetical protein ACR2JC_06050 [Chloroflexota bacterium]